ncbi:MAG: hypothetical protein H9533_19955 [Rhodobacteraceae bacterium]|nr:hypothetical protein [Paracoccaceae bacterium]
MKADLRDLLPKLRETGFLIWDPLGLAEAWKGAEPIADEYDHSLIRAFSVAANGGDLRAVCAVLLEAEIRMGLAEGGPANRREIAARSILRTACQHGGE